MTYLVTIYNTGGPKAHIPDLHVLVATLQGDGAPAVTLRDMTIHHSLIFPINVTQK